MNTDASEDDTVELLPGVRLQALGRLGLSMIESQRRVLPGDAADKEERHFLLLCRAAAKGGREWVPARELVALARFGLRVRAELRRDRGRPITADYQAAVIAQRRYDAAAEAAIAHQQESLPGMGGEVEGGGPA